jgi:hypothetical protein
MIRYMARQAVRAGTRGRPPQRRIPARPVRRTARQRRSEAMAHQVAAIMCLAVLAALVIIVLAH